VPAGLRRLASRLFDARYRSRQQSRHHVAAGRPPPSEWQQTGNCAHARL